MKLSNGAPERPFFERNLRRIIALGAASKGLTSGTATKAACALEVRHVQKYEGGLSS